MKLRVALLQVTNRPPPKPECQSIRHSPAFDIVDQAGLSMFPRRFGIGRSEPAVVVGMKCVVVVIVLNNGDHLRIGQA